MLSRYLTLGAAAVTVGAAFAIVSKQKQKTEVQTNALQKLVQYNTLTLNQVGTKA